MNINDVVNIQGCFNLRNSTGKNIGKEITKKLEFNVINELMGKFKYKKGKIGKSQAEKLLTTTQANSAYNLSLSKPPPPDWTYMPTKSEPAMSETEFEEAIKSLALEYAERATEIGNSGKSNSMINKELYNLNRELEWKEWKLRTSFISVVSPDRKSTYAKYDGKEPFLYGNNGKISMISGPSGWIWYPTEEEEARISKYAQIYGETLRAYEAEHGQIPYTTISKTWVQ
jgi:hypothetical protein